jgi:haloalkane dehalogenase
MEFLTTPDPCFDNLPDYPFAPQYLTVTDADGTDFANSLSR